MLRKKQKKTKLDFGTIFPLDNASRHLYISLTSTAAWKPVTTPLRYLWLDSGHYRRKILNSSEPASLYRLTFPLRSTHLATSCGGQMWLNNERISWNLQGAGQSREALPRGHGEKETAIKLAGTRHKYTPGTVQSVENNWIRLRDTIIKTL